MSATEDFLLDAEDRMEKVVGVLKNNLAGIRTGRANPGLVDSLRVMAYGSEVPIKQLASIAAPEPTQILIRPYDAGTIKDIEKAIMSSGLSISSIWSVASERTKSSKLLVVYLKVELGCACVFQ